MTSLCKQYYNESVECRCRDYNISNIPDLWEATFNSINDLISLHDKKSTIIRVNTAFADTFKKRPNELVGKKCYEVVHRSTTPCPNCPHQQTIKTLEPVTEEFYEPILGKYVQVSTSPIFDDKSEIIGTVHIIKDITERIQAKEALIKANKLLGKEVEKQTNDLIEANMALEREVVDRKKAEAVKEELIRHKDMFITRLGHDLKTPLTPLVGLLPLIRNQVDDPKTQNLIDACVLNVKRIKYLAIKAIKVARANSITRVIAMENVPVMLKVNDYIEKRDFIIKQKRIAFENNIGPEIIIMANEADLEELFYNLISNAVKYTPENGAVTIDAKVDDEKVTVSIKDTGIGLSEQHIDRIFDEFFKVDEARHELNSSGLGLSICRKIVENHGGTIWAESKGEGHGTTFYFTIKAGRPGREDEL